MKKARSTRELVNYFPSYSQVRNNWQSIGAQFLNTLGVQIDDMDKYLEKMKKNAFLATVNLDEIDWAYKVKLPATFSFTLDTTDQLQPTYSAPTVQGLVSSNIYDGYVDVTLADDNSLENLWYEATIDRVDWAETVSGEDSLLHWPSTSFPFSGLLTHHLSDGGRVWVETTSGTQYVSINDDGEIDRATLTLVGTTRKGTKETETLVFPWDMKQSTSKEWKYITYVETHNFEDDVSIELRSADFDWGPYLSFYNLRWSEDDTKIDEFWDIGEEISAGTTLDLVGYIANDWENLVLGFSGTTVRDSWELIDWDLNTIDAVDMAVQPFTDRAWIVDSSKLYCFGMEETMVSGIDFLVDKTSGSHFRIEASDDYYVLGDDITFTPLHVRPIQQVAKYRLWYKTPSGTKYGLDSGSPVAFTADFWKYPTELKRELEGEITITATERGEYKIALEAVYPDGTSFVDRKIIPVKYKQPLSAIDISDHVSGSILGIDFDSDQKLWVKTTVAYYRFSLHADLMIIDYSDKIIYFREDYTSVEIS